MKILVHASFFYENKKNYKKSHKKIGNFPQKISDLLLKINPA
jgi:hypothetical protein